ncbi:MAG: nucleotidyltransferase domain-containing protein, partial [Pseudomonadota bacterium]
MHFAKSKILNVASFKQQVSDSTDDDGLPSIEPFKQALKHAHLQLTLNQNQGVSAADLIEKFTWMIDQLVIESWHKHTHAFDTQQELELVAVGGYGRGELHPHSDVDLLLLTEKVDQPQVTECLEHFLRFLWDIGLDVGHSVRSVKDCIKEAKADVTIMTNLLEGRQLAGDAGLFEQVDVGIRVNKIWPAEKFFAAKVAEQEQRHSQQQDSAYSLEPNLKDSPGGLRDLQTILWIYNRRYGVRSFKEMNEAGHISNDEYRLLIRARNILWKMRTGLHLLAARHEDRLLFDTQRALAADFGYTDSKTTLAVEQLMKRYYRTAKQVLYLNEVLLSAYREENSYRSPLRRQKQIDEDFVLINKSISQRESDLFSRKPIAMLKLFALMQDKKITAIHPETIRAIRTNLALVDSNLRSDPRAQEIFINMFEHEGIGLTNALARMNAYGLLGAYIPAFGAIVGQMQHDLFHVYTVDGHTLMVIKNLTRLRKYPDEFP